MISLLSGKEKRARKQEKDLKLIFIIGVFILSALVVAVLSFLSIKFYLANQVKYQEISIEVHTAKTSSIKLLDEKISRINNILFEFNNFYDQQFMISTFLDSLNNILLPSVLLESFSYTGEDSRVMITGTASDIEEAYELRNTLREQEELSNLVFTLPDWLQVGKIDFRIEFDLKNESF